MPCPRAGRSRQASQAASVDGAIRDSASILETGLPVWSGDSTTRRRAVPIRKSLQLNGPVSLCGNLVQPGDYLVADIDGVCVIPFDAVPAVVEYCERSYAKEVAFIDRIESAATLEELVAGLKSETTPS